MVLMKSFNRTILYQCIKQLLRGIILLGSPKLQFDHFKPHSKLQQAITRLTLYIIFSHGSVCYEVCLNEIKLKSSHITFLMLGLMYKLEFYF